MSLNISVLCGRLTADPVLKKTSAGMSVVSFNLAVDRDFKKEGSPTADFISIQCWNKTADNVAKYCHKGSRINIKGRIQTRNYDDANGKKVYVTEVVADSVQFLDTKSSQQSDERSQPNQYSSGAETSDTGDDALEISADDLPF